jgi:hypothetical protein
VLLLSKCLRWILYSYSVFTYEHSRTGYIGTCLLLLLVLRNGLCTPFVTTQSVWSGNYDAIQKQVTPNINMKQQNVEVDTAESFCKLFSCQVAYIDVQRERTAYLWKVTTLNCYWHGYYHVWGCDRRQLSNIDHSVTLSSWIKSTAEKISEQHCEKARIKCLVIVVRRFANSHLIL